MILRAIFLRCWSKSSLGLVLYGAFFHPFDHHPVDLLCLFVRGSVGALLRP